MSSLSSFFFLYQPLLQEADNNEESNKHDPRFSNFGPLHVHVDQQYHLVALARPATNIADDEDSSEEEDVLEDEDDAKNRKANSSAAAAIAIVTSNNSMAFLLLWLILTLLLTSQFYMTLWLHNHNMQPITTTTSRSMVPHFLCLTIFLLSVLLYASTLYVLNQSVGGIIAGLRKNSNLRHCQVIVTIMIALLIPAEILLDILLLLVLWNQIEPRLAALLAGSLIVGTCIVVMSSRQLLISGGTGDDIATKKRRRRRFLGSLVQV
jgi:hypothetical protein